MIPSNEFRHWCGATVMAYTRRCFKGQCFKGQCFKMLAYISIAALAVAASPLLSQINNDLLNANRSDAEIKTSDLATEPPEFLRYEEAYILTAAVDDGTTNSNIVTLNWEIEPGYYLYHKEFVIKAYVHGEQVESTVEIPEGLLKYDEYFGENRRVFYDAISIPVTIGSGVTDATVNLSVRAQGCADAGLCYNPVTEYFEIDFDSGTTTAVANFLAKQNPGASGTTATASDSGAEAISIMYLLYMMLLALMGGVLLNLMPCVFPVLSLKALSFVSAKGSDHSHHVHGWVYTAGVVSSFLVLGGIIIGIRAGGGDADWGMQLQSPLFVTLMIYLFLVMGLSLSGFVYFGNSLMGLGQSLTTRKGLEGSFFTGVLAVVVASPCSAPFMATALGVALTQNAAVAILIFTSLGLGLALPFLILSYSPKLASLLPKPGAWMETLKQVLAFPLYLTAIGGLWVLGRQTGTDTLAVVALGAIMIVFALWLWQKRPSSTIGKYSQIATCVLAIVGSLALATQAPRFGKGDYWLEYSPELVAQLRAEGRPIFINMTAAWCTTCHANELIALGRDEVKETAEKYNVAMIKGDYTNEDPRITALLNEYNRPSVPLYLMFSPDSSKRAEILPQFLTIETVVKAMERAAVTPTLAQQ